MFLRPSLASQLKIKPKKSRGRLRGKAPAMATAVIMAPADTARVGMAKDTAAVMGRATPTPPAITALAMQLPRAANSSNRRARAPTLPRSSSSSQTKRKLNRRQRRTVRPPRIPCLSGNNKKTTLRRLLPTLRRLVISKSNVSGIGQF